jgi:CheY-like chemotaxis protein
VSEESVVFLLIDDNWLALSGWIVLLERASYKVTKSNDAERALRYFCENSNDIQCVILDVMMPAPPEWRELARGGKTTGILLANKLRELDQRVPILFLTNQRDAAVINTLKEYPSSRYIDKRELRPESFVSLVERKLSELKELAGKGGQTATAPE